MTVNIDPNGFQFFRQIAPFCVGGAFLLLLVGIGVPLLMRATFWVEAVTLLLEGLGSYFENRALVWAGFLLLVSLCFACCILTLLVVFIVGGNTISPILGCGTNNPSFLCGITPH
jgi:hypothetical protein